MNIKKNYSIAAISLILFLSFFSIQFFTKPKPPKLSGAGIALDNFVTSRAYPDSIIPHQQYQKAFNRHQEMQILSKKKDDHVWEAIGPKNFLLIHKTQILYGRVRQAVDYGKLQPTVWA